MTTKNGRKTTDEVCAPSEAGEIGDDIKGRGLVKILMQPMHPVNQESSSLSSPKVRANMSVSRTNSLLCLPDRCTGYGRKEYAPLVPGEAMMTVKVHLAGTRQSQTACPARGPGNLHN